MAPTCKPCARYKNKPTKANTPSAHAGVFSVPDGGPGRNRPGPEDV